MSGVWQEAEESRGYSNPPVEYQFTETSVAQAFDGDVFGAIYYREYRGGWSLTHQAGDVEDEVAATYLRAADRLSGMRYDRKTGRFYMLRNWDADAAIERYMRIFHDTAYITGITGGYDRSGDWVVFDTPDWRKKCGIEGGPNVENIQDVATELVKVLDGDVWGIGYAVNEARRLPSDEPIDLLDGDWNIDIECWGFIGEEYAQQSALAFEHGSPTLPPMLPIEVTE
jgi:hypothetical protein